MKTIIKISTILLMTFLSANMFGQNNSVTIGGTETISDAVLWLIPSGNEGKQGLVLPQVERTGFVPSMDGMIIFDPSDQTIYVWDGAEWQGLGSGGTGTADDWGTQTVVTDPVLTGEGTAIDPLTLAPQDAGLGQVLKWNGSTWAPAIDETGEGGSSVNSVNEITGDGTLANPLQLAQQAATVGQILKWDGTAWTPAEDAGGTGSTYLAGLGIEIDADNNIINTGDADADPANEFQTLSFDVLTNELSLSDGNSISIPTGGTDADADPTNEIQTISFDAVTNELSLTEGGTVTIPTGGADADADPTNEIQDLTLSGTTINISGGAGVDIAALIPPGGTDDQNLIMTGDELSIEGGTGVVDLSVYGDDADADPSNEIQTISFDPGTNELSLTNGGTVTIPSGGTDADADPTNEIQDLTLSGTTINISGGAGVDIAALIPPGGTDDQNLIMTGDELSIEGGTGVIDLSVYGDDADADPTNEIQDLTLSGSTINISGGAGVDIAALIPPGGTDDQNLIMTGDELSIEGGTGVIDLSVYGDDADADPLNEIQTITYNGLTGEIQLSDGGGTVTLPSGGDGAFESVGGVVKPATMNTDDFVFGSDQLDDDPGTDEDNKRMFFDKSNGSFRMGETSDNDQWDIDNRGLRSMAVGYNTIASDEQSVAMGYYAQATNWESISMGFYTESTGQQSVAMGNNTSALANQATAFGNMTEASGLRSTAMGSNSEASGDNSTATGFETIAEGDQSTALGNTTTASGENATALGHNTIASGITSLATGDGTTASGQNSFTTGVWSTASGNSAMTTGFLNEASGDAALAANIGNIAEGDGSSAFGNGTKAEAYVSAAMGRFNVGGGNQEEWVAINPLFEIGIGVDDANRANAMTVLKNGNVGFGESVPFGELVVGSSMGIFYPTLKEITVGGEGENGGVLMVGNAEKQVRLFGSNGQLGITSFDTDNPFEIGDFRITARTFYLGDAPYTSPYMMNIDQDFDYGIHHSNGDYGWEHWVSAANTVEVFAGDLVLRSDAAGTVGAFDYFSGQYFALSDRSTKEDISTMGTVLTKVNQLEPLSYHFIGAPDKKNSLGFIAQDVKEIFPDLVTFVKGREGEEDRHLMNYSGFGVIAIAAIQEQQEELEKQQKQIDHQQSEIDELKKMMESLLKREGTLSK